MKKLLGLLLILSGLTFAQSFTNWQSTPASARDNLLYSLKYAPLATDTFEFNYEKSPGLAFLLSAVLPGAGEYYAGARYRALAFLTVEAVSWGIYLERKGTGREIEKRYKNFANSNWSLYNWYYNSFTYPDYFGMKGSHAIWLEYVNDGLELEANEDTLTKYVPNWTSILYNERDLPYNVQTLRPVRTRDFYENIGKYDQFATGWKDFSNSLVDTAHNEVQTSPLRNKYLNDRYKSNQAFKMATNFVTVIMFNHLISAFHAQIAAKQYQSQEAKDVSWHWALLADYRYRFPLRGINLAVHF